MTDHAQARYLLMLALFAAAILLALAGFNAFIDPYGQFDTPKFSGINQRTLGFNHRLPLAKALAASRIKPVSIILGNSHAETTYDPDYPGFTERPSYNLAIAGAGFEEIRRYFLEARAAGNLRHVLLALDFTMFDPLLPAQDDGIDSILLTDRHGVASDANRPWRRLAFVLLSGTATSDSWWSLTHQDKPVALYSASGLRDESADIEQVVREGGHRRASIRAESNFFLSLLRDTTSRNFEDGYRQIMGQLHETLAMAAERNIRLTMIINPIHARYTYAYSAAGLWPAYERWKRDLSAMTEQTNRRDLISLWDFSGVTACTAEPVPPDGDAAFSMHWYRESSHFRPTLGEQVLDIALMGRSDGPCPGLGVRLRPATLEDTLASQLRSLSRWIAAHPDDAAEIDHLAERYGRRVSRVRSAPNN